MTDSFTDKTALVIGGVNGMGRETVAKLVGSGARVAVIDKDAEGAEALVDELGSSVSIHTADVLDEDAFRSAVASAMKHLGARLDILIHIAGASRGGFLADQEMADWDWHYRVNLRSHVLSCKLAAEMMRPQGFGAIVTMSSISGLRGDPGWAGYNASKAAIKSLTESLAWELGPFGIRVNAVCPGPVSSERMLKSLETGDGKSAAMIQGYKEHTALGRLIEPTEVASAILFLASDAASAITGHALVVDCGLTSTTGQPT